MSDETPAESGFLFPLSTSVQKWACKSPIKTPAGPARCRRCETCLKVRQYQWKRRVMFEASLAKRSWWCLFSLARPSIYSEVKDAIDRVNEAFPCRFIAVEEFGTRRGRLHWHVLFHFGRHEPTRRGHERPTKREIVDAAEWDKGFLTLELCKDAAAVGAYLGEYMTKEAGKGVIKGRSIRYGMGYEPHPRGNELVAAVYREFPNARITRTRANKSARWIDAWAKRPGSRLGSLMYHMRRAEAAGDVAGLIRYRRDWYREIDAENGREIAAALEAEQVYSSPPPSDDEIPL